MKTKLTILAGFLALMWLVGESGPDAAAGKALNDPPAAKEDKPATHDSADADKDDDAPPMAGPENPRDRRPPRDLADDDDGGDRPRNGWRGDRRERGKFHGDRRDRRPRRGPRGRDRMRPDDNRPVPPDQEAKALEILKQRLPEFHEKLTKLREKRPERYQKVLCKIMPMMQEFMDLQRDHPEMADVVIEEFKTERDLRTLIRKYMDARRDKDADAQAKLEPEFRELMKHRHELEVKRRQFRLDDFRQRLEREQQRLEEEERRLEEDNAHFEEDLDRRVESLRQGHVREALGPPPGQGPGPGFDGPPHRGPRRGGFDRPPRHGHRRGGFDRPPRGDGPPDAGEPRPPRRGERDGDRPPPPRDEGDDLDL